eukprot:TRINITY_DN10727_c0_g1_i1.p1 TRINITY_DN10727_c0_g1~~TRINITY_DN10727_c0_g1_i1.p1  ORF type:complete len:329 (-),score=34.08 TRINITY_DN10727_c0_g1_i1:125-1111(-)
MFQTFRRLKSIILSASISWNSCHGDFTSLTQISSTCSAMSGCPTIPEKTTSPSGMTNYTGFTTDGKACCDTCSAADARKINCFSNVASCAAKRGNNDWDFLVLDQIWLPQLCNALEQGHDPTVSHLYGSRCRSGAVRRTGISIHGLWPNYIGGFPSCCAHVELPQHLPPDVFALASLAWVDPTYDANDSCSACGMWAHEMMKHGSCFATDMTGYFRATLGLAHRLKDRLDAASKLLTAATERPIATVQFAEIFAPYTVQVICDKRDKRRTNRTGIFLEFRTCWNRTRNFAPERANSDDLLQIQCLGLTAPSTCPEFFIAEGGENILIV